MSIRKKKNYIKNWKKQTRDTMTDNTKLMFGKYRLKYISEVKVTDPGYYNWLCNTFKIE